MSTCNRLSFIITISTIIYKVTKAYLNCLSTK
nr:MAG TPA: Glutamyl-tRNAGlu reductase, N-terminal domain [Caudoviricetes sp.]